MRSVLIFNMGHRFNVTENVASLEIHLSTGTRLFFIGDPADIERIRTRIRMAVHS